MEGCNDKIAKEMEKALKDSGLTKEDFDPIRTGAVNSSQEASALPRIVNSDAKKPTSPER